MTTATDSVTVAQALSSLGSDLTLAISFSIAHELLAAAEDAQIQQAELIGIVLSTTVVLSVLPNAFAWTMHELSSVRAIWRGDMASAASVCDRHESRMSLGQFAALFVSIAQRISASICVQLVAANVKATQPLRSVRLLTLVGVAVFFVFLESTAALGRVKNTN
jgi:hypothetical protein